MTIGDRTPLAVLLTAAGRGDHAAFAEVYDSTSQQIYGAISQRLDDPKQAEALTLKIFLDIWRTSPRFNPDACPAWLWIIICAEHNTPPNWGPYRATQASRGKRSH